MNLAEHITPCGLRLEGPFENARNAANAQLFKDIIRECFGVADVIVAHHIVYVATERRDGFEYQIVEEIPSADALMFNHEVARHLWGDKWQDTLRELACTPVMDRDARLAQLYYARGK